jgi:hypothetical protein
MGFGTIAGLLALSGGVVSVFIPTGHRWLAVAGVAGAILTALVLWATTSFEGFEGPTWGAIALLVFFFGGGWSAGVLVGYLIREGWIRRPERSQYPG